MRVTAWFSLLLTTALAAPQSDSQALSSDLANWSSLGNALQSLNFNFTLPTKTANLDNISPLPPPSAPRRIRFRSSPRSRRSSRSLIRQARGSRQRALGDLALHHGQVTLHIAGETGVPGWCAPGLELAGVGAVRDDRINVNVNGSVVHVEGCLKIKERVAMIRNYRLWMM
ncbi:hypothetical protein CNMCM6457_005524 [Aspergillus fumigatiaffinis]|nr:hypothetical protein CNMCM6457_005524 [Aspergillus fumigatiaffinis]